MTTKTHEKYILVRFDGKLLIRQYNPLTGYYQTIHTYGKTQVQEASRQLDHLKADHQKFIENLYGEAKTK